MFLVSNYLLIYVYEFFIDICLYYVLFEIKILFYLLVFFPHMRLCIFFKCFNWFWVSNLPYVYKGNPSHVFVSLILRFV